MFTDASNDGLGIVSLIEDRIATLSRPWTPEEIPLPINTKEVIAAFEGVTQTVPRRQTLLVLLGVDNTSAFYDIVTGSSRCSVANSCVLNLRTGYSIGLLWIPSELMPADAPSRFIEDDQIPDKIRMVLQASRCYAFLPKLL